MLENQDTWFAKTQKQWFCEKQDLCRFVLGRGEKKKIEALVHPNTETIPSCGHF